MAYRQLQLEEPEFRCLCIERVCKLCRFPFTPGMKIVIGAENAYESKPFSFPDEYDYELSNEEWRLCFRSCSPLCSHYDGSSYGFHVECLAFARRFDMRFFKMLNATVSSYQPLEIDRERRHKHMVGLITSRIQATYRRLPTEVWRMVAEHLVPFYAIAALLSLSEIESYREIDACAKAWATYVNIDGIRYVRTISNTPIPKGEVVWDAVSPGMRDVLYLVEDHLGIRQVTTNPGAPQFPNERLKSTWWRSVPLEQRQANLCTDGYKLRAIRSSWHRMEGLWPEPISPPQYGLQSFLFQWPLPYARLIPLELNNPNVIGYSACWRGSLISLHSHRLNEDAEFFHEIGYPEDGPVWTFLAMNPGKTVTEIWRRDDPEFFASAIAFRTNTGRTMIGGQVVSYLLKHLHRWVRIARFPEKGTSRMFFEYSASGIHMMSIPLQKRFDEVGPCPTETAFALGMFITSGPEFHSSASLEDVVEVVLCESDDDAPPRITGLLFRYKNGNHASVGSFRPRRDATQLSVPPNSSALFLATKFETRLRFNGKSFRGTGYLSGGSVLMIVVCVMYWSGMMRQICFLR
ncbi:hypothetical protein BGZ61DRAFT_535247 [Ilyonectria robusta]|uniref:uncharacterized protein n=1 Tax=Ilyonectria robusta TaxID=1079257 RepID=UPI001E8DC173|nr:uncharacterized protein BGZ61DRAFT_535247 [Ilyonectria robusta]KAH8680165.1 hypothetical protein BGZ61DRAFT_535247 [Ilyonectria robusta]